MLLKIDLSSHYMSTYPLTETLTYRSAITGSMKYKLRNPSITTYFDYHLRQAHFKITSVGTKFAQTKSTVAACISLTYERYQEIYSSLSYTIEMSNVYSLQCISEWFSLSNIQTNSIGFAGISVNSFMANNVAIAKHDAQTSFNTTTIYTVPSYTNYELQSTFGANNKSAVNMHNFIGSFSNTYLGYGITVSQEESSGTLLTKSCINGSQVSTYDICYG